jgi:V8-like Glu-specific endopeptidase
MHMCVNEVVRLPAIVQSPKKQAQVRRRLRCSTGLVALLGALAVACSSSEPPVDSSGSDLIGGSVAARGEFPSTLQIIGGCTVTKVGEQVLLVAAHCVRTPEGQIKDDFAKGQLLFVSFRRPSAATGGQDEAKATLQIARTVIHPRIAHYCQKQTCGQFSSDDRRDAPDVAIIQIISGLTDVPIAKVDLTPAQPDDEVTMLGYGCTTNWSAGQGDGKLRFKNTQLAPATITIHPGGLAPNEAAGLRSIEANDVFTKGTAGGGEAGLCPGDSGGALYRKNTNLVVGVNSTATFLPGERLVPVTNWFARVDRNARWGTATWLQSMGVQLTGNCTPETCTPVRFEDAP